MEFVIAYPRHTIPASNGEVERAVRTFKESMKTMKDEPGTLAGQSSTFPSELSDNASYSNWMHPC